MPRGCGGRIAGGAYLEIPLGTTRAGHPIEEFLYCQPQAVDAAVMGMSAIGVTLVDDAQGVTHVLDIIGSEHYPNVVSFVEEARQKGVSRRFPAQEHYFERLTAQSRLVLAHARAIILNPDAYLLWEPEQVEGWRRQCPSYIGPAHCGRGVAQDGHERGGKPEFCARFWWQDATGDAVEPIAAVGAGPDDYYVKLTEAGVRTYAVGDMHYLAHPRLPVCEPEYAMGFIGSFPICQITVIRDPIDGTHEETLERASKASLPLVLEDE